MSKLPTPDYKITEEEEQSVYSPAEDTFLLLDALEADRELIASVDPILCVEIGSGSGVVSAFLRTVISDIQRSSSAASTSKNVYSLCTDLNLHALRCTQRTFQLNRQKNATAKNVEGPLSLLHCNLLDPLLHRLRNSVDILLMNPPYVLTEQTAQSEQELCYAGGPSGRALLDALLPKVADVLSARGLFYLVALRENGVAELCSSATCEKYGIAGELVLERQCRNEHLSVIRFRRIDAVATKGAQQEATSSEISKTSENCPAEPSSPSPLKGNPIPSPMTPSTPSSSSTASKITVYLKPVGGAPQLAKEYSKLATRPQSTVASIQQVLRKWLNMKPTDSLYLFVAESFAPFPEQTIGNLYACFGSRDSPKLYLQYGTTPAWG